MMNTISNILKYIALPLSFLALSTSQAAQISDHAKSNSGYNFFSRIFSRKTTQIEDNAKGYNTDDEKIDYTVKKSTGLGLLPYDQWPKNRQLVYSPSLSKKENNEILINKNNDRRKKIEKLPLKLLPNKESFDISYYVVKVYAHFGFNEDNGKNIEGQGTATIIKIKKGIIYLLTCAHNVIKHEHNPFKGDKVYHAKNVSFFYKGKEYSCNDYYVYPKYVVDEKKGIVDGKKDIAIITSHGGYGIKFPYTSFPQIASISKGSYSGHVIGFPGEKEKKGELYGMSGDLAVKEVFVEYKIDTSYGQSGSPIWAKVNGFFKIIGVHTYGIEGLESYNCGPLLNSEFMAYEQAYWIQVQKAYNKHMEFFADPSKMTVILQDPTFDANMVNEKKLTPFIYAAKKGNLPALKMLKEKGANVYAKDEFGHDALHYMINNDTIKKKIEKAEEKIQQLTNQVNDQDSELYEKDIELNKFKNKFNNKNKTLQHTQNKLKETQLKLYNKENLLNQRNIENEKALELIQRLMKRLKDKDNELNRLKTQPKRNNNNINKKYPQHFKYSKNRYKGKSLPKDLSGQDLSGYDFTGCHFTYTNLTDTNLENTCLTNTTCDYTKAFQDHLKENKCEKGDWYKKNLPKDLKSIAEVYPKLKKHADKVKLLHIACGLSRLPFYTNLEFYIKVQYWSCALLQLTKKLGNPYGKQIVCSYEDYLNWDAEDYCWSTEYPQNAVNLDEKPPHADFGTYLTHFNNGLVKHKCKSKDNWGFNWYKDNIEKNIKGLQKAYPKIESKELQKEACQIGCALSKSYQIRGMLFLFHYLFYQNRLIRFRNSAGVMVKNDIHYNFRVGMSSQHHYAGVMVKNDIHYNLSQIFISSPAVSWNSMT